MRIAFVRSFGEGQGSSLMSPPLKSRQRHHACRMLVARTAEVRGGGENGAGDRPRGRRFDRPAVCGGKTGQGCGRGRETSFAADAVGAGAGRTATQVADLERTVAAEASHGGSGELRAQPMGGTDGV